MAKLNLDGMFQGVMGNMTQQSNQELTKAYG